MLLVKAPVQQPEASSCLAFWSFGFYHIILISNFLSSRSFSFCFVMACGPMLRNGQFLVDKAFFRGYSSNRAFNVGFAQSNVYNSKKRSILYAKSVETKSEQCVLSLLPEFVLSSFRA